MIEPDTQGAWEAERERRRAAWTRWLALGGGNVCGLASDAEALARALTHRAPPSSAGLGLAGAAFLAGVVFLPAVVTGIAPRQCFLWGAVPAGLVFVWSLMDRVAALNGPGFVHDFRDNGITALCFLLLIVGPISLVRGWRRRGREAQARRWAEQEAWRQGMADGQAGVWPPPPTRPGEP